MQGRIIRRRAAQGVKRGGPVPVPANGLGQLDRSRHFREIRASLHRDPWRSGDTGDPRSQALRRGGIAGKEISRNRIDRSRIFLVVLI